MDSKEQLSAKKKKDLVEIAVHFGFLSQTNANKMTKATLVDFLIDQSSNENNDKKDLSSDLSAEDTPQLSAQTADERVSSDTNRREKSVAKKTAKRSSSTSKKSNPQTKKIRNTKSPKEEKTDKDSKESKSSKDDKERTVSNKEESNNSGHSSQSTKQRRSKSRRRSIIIQPKETESEASDDNSSTQTESQLNESDNNTQEPSGNTPRTLKVKEPEPEIITGVLEIMSDGFGFIRRDNYLPSNNDVFIHSNYIRRFGLRTGDLITGPVRPKKSSDKYAPLQYIKEVNEQPPEKMLRRPHFERLTPIYPDERFVLETQKTELSTRIIDLIAPIGKGQRGMIVSPPKAGKTILLKKIANAISTNNPDAKLIVLLIDERPEEVTDMQRSIDGEVVYSTFDKKPENHTKIVELVLERAMRLVEMGQDVVILLDSMTRLSRAYNLTINPTGRTLSGGLDPGALYGPKRFFGAARNIENGGSLTIIATSLIETGSRMDEVIFEEFKGTGNMEVYLDRKLSEKRIFPAIDINKSGTRREDLLLASNELDAVWTIRKAFSQLDTSAVTEMIISLLLKTQSNQQFVQSVNVSFNDKALFDAMRGGGGRPAGTSATTNGNGNGK